jgi:hypothetical protein
LEVGPAAQFDGKPKVLKVLEGVHSVEIRQGASIILDDKFFVSSGETHAIAVVSGSK